MRDDSRAPGPGDWTPMPDPYGEATPCRPLREPLVVHCRGCAGLFEVHGFSASAERGEFLCTRCQRALEEVADGWRCALCEGPKEQRYGRCGCADDACVEDCSDEEKLP